MISQKIQLKWFLFLRCIVAFFVSFTFVSFASAATIIQRPLYVGIASGLVSAWSFDGATVSGVSVADISGQANHGTMTNGPTTSRGKIGQAMVFDGVDDGLRVGDSSGFSFDANTSLTISVWIKPNVAYARGVLDADIVTHGPPGNNNISGFTLSTGYFSVNDASGIGIRTTGDNGPFVSGTWYHVVGVHDRVDGVSRVYVDGALHNSVSASEGAINGTGNVVIAEALEQGYFNGVVDDIRIYNRALSPAEIKRLHRIGATFTVNKAAADGTTEQGLVGYWDFDGNEVAHGYALDRSDNNNRGTLTNGPSVAKGKLGQALLFDSNDDYVNVGSASVLDDLSAMSISAWIYPHSEGESNTGAIVTKDTAGSAGNWRFRFGSGTNNLEFFKDGSTDLLVETSNNAIMLNQWQHVVLVWDGSTAAANTEIYINGVEATYQTQTNGNSFISDASLDVILGNRRSSATTFDGSIDDVRIYNRTLSANEIKRLYKIGATFTVNNAAADGTIGQDLVGYWDFDGADLQRGYAPDRSGNNNRGTLTNGPSVVKGKLGQALAFNGSSHVITVPHASVHNPTHVSVSFWTRLTETPGDFDSPMMKTTNNDWQDGWGFFWNNTNTLRFFVDSWNASDAFVSFSGGDREWHHVVGVFDGTKTQIFLDTVAGTSETVSSYTGSTRSLFVGSAPQGDEVPGWWWPGIIDDVRIYNRALSVEEVRRLYMLGR